MRNKILKATNETHALSSSVRLYKDQFAHTFKKLSVPKITKSFCYCPLKYPVDRECIKLQGAMLLWISHILTEFLIII